ncbi:hypothetical protein [Pseudomonas sp. BJa3]|uniref:hypothetical protein n=1 Tax=Pseudomonas sp. BJa3 TaxID=2986525 RepID=UPI002265B456|nr:hypothetical protein [Pseudomonas sp. BJa3]MCX5511311.1 hypothetical protein [Pseudomonas sp. BJa3]
MKALLFIAVFMAAGAGFAEWFVFVLKLDLGVAGGFVLGMAPIALLGAIPFRKLFADRKENH